MWGGGEKGQLGTGEDLNYSLPVLVDALQAKHGKAQQSKAQQNTAKHSKAQHSTAQQSKAQQSTAKQSRQAP